MSDPSPLGNRGILLLAFASAVVTANAYYIHPIIGRVAESFSVSAGLVGAVPAFNQVALALGVLLLLPLGDRISNRRLVLCCLAAQVGALLTMALAQDFRVFVGASTLLGFFTVTPYLLPAYASKRVSPQRLGFVTAVLTTGVISGVQLSRLSSGLIGEHLGWRAVYWIAASLMTVAAVALPLLMNEERRGDGSADTRYSELLRSLWTLARRHPDVLISGLIQGLSFAIFLAIWLGIGLHLTSPGMGLGTDLVGYLAAFSAVGLLTTPRLGKWADGFGPERARMVMALIQLAGVLSLAISGQQWWLLTVPIAITSIAGPLIDITGRMTTLSQPAEIRTRLMSLFITLMFLGGGLGSWAGTLAYDAGGWRGTVLLCTGLSLLVCLLAFRQWRRAGGRH